jgi:hypothetical protein
MLTFPYVVSMSRHDEWGFSFHSYDLILSRDTTTPYSILRLGPMEFFIRSKSRELDWF